MWDLPNEELRVRLFSQDPYRSNLCASLDEDRKKMSPQNAGQNLNLKKLKAPLVTSVKFASVWKTTQVSWYQNHFFPRVVLQIFQDFVTQFTIRALKTFLFCVRACDSLNLPERVSPQFSFYFFFSDRACCMPRKLDFYVLLSRKHLVSRVKITEKLHSKLKCSEKWHFAEKMFELNFRKNKKRQKSL